MLISAMTVVSLLLPGQCVSELPRRWTPAERQVIDSTRRAERRGVVVPLGTLRRIDLPKSVTTFDSAPSGVVELKALEPHKLLVIGTSLGRATITLTGAAGQTRRQATVVPSGPEGCAWADWIRWLTPDTARTPRFLIGGDRVRISGEVDSTADYRRLKDLVRGLRVGFEVRLSQAAIDARLDALDAQLRQAGVEGARARWRGEDFVLEPEPGLGAEALVRVRLAAEPLLEKARAELR